jgi:hypothetical protein
MGDGGRSFVVRPMSGRRGYSESSQRLGGFPEPASTESGHAIGIVHTLLMGKRDGVSGAYWLVAA